MTDGGAARGTREASVCDQGDCFDQFGVGGNGLCRVEHFGHTASFGSFVADEDGFARLDVFGQYGLEGVFFAIEYACFQGRLHQFGRDGGVLDDGAFRCEVARQDGDGALCPDRVIEGFDDVGYFYAEGLQVFTASFVEAALLQGVEVFT